MTEEELELKRSKEIVGEISPELAHGIYPVLIDAEGKTIDGKHRVSSDSEWKRQKLKGVKTEKQRIIVRIHANLQRRGVPTSERQEEFTRLAEILGKEGVRTGEILDEICRLTCFSKGYVAPLLPDKFKRAYEKSLVTKHLEPPILCKAQNLIEELVRAIDVGHNFEGNCKECEIAEKCGEVREFIKRILQQ